MTLFGQTLDAQQLFGLVSLLAVLTFWLVVLGREQGYRRWFQQWDAGRKGRRDAGPETNPRDPPTPSDRKGPWG